MTLAILVLCVYGFNISFTACAPHSFWCDTAYAFTSSGGTMGFFILVLITGLFYASSASGKKQKTLVFFKSVLSLLIFFGVLAFINEHYTKPILKSQRPSHIYMLNQTGLISVIDSLYQLDVNARHDFFEKLVQSHPSEFVKIDTEIQKHWIDESGFSFPSGHTFNAFLFAMILSYAILFNRSYPHLRWLFFLPFVWAFFVGVSRVAMGAHHALDVSVGAFLGLSIGYIFLYIEKTRHWLTRKN